MQKVSRPNVADWQYLGVDKITRRLEWNCARRARKGHICEDSLAYASYSNKDDNTQLLHSSVGQCISRLDSCCCFCIFTAHNQTKRSNP